MSSNYTDEYWLQQLRIKSARRKKRLVKLDEEKTLRKLHTQCKNIWNEMNKLGWEELDPPYQRGWKRFFVIKLEMERSRNASFYKKLLEKINTQQYSSRKDFKKKKRIKRKRVYMSVKQCLQALNEREFQKLSQPEQIFFTKENVWCNRVKAVITQYVFMEPNRFYSLKVEPNMITKVRKRNVLLESSLAEIELKIERNKLRPRMNRLIYGRYGHWSWKMNEYKMYRNPLRNKPVKKILDEYYCLETICDSEKK